MADRLRWAVMGTGLIAGILPRINEADGCVVAGVASRDRDRARAFSEKHGVDPAGACTYEELIVRDDIDAVYVALPNHLHVEWCERLLGAGKHVLCEKPLALSAAEVKRACDAAERAGRVLAEGFMFMHHAQTDRLAEIARAGETPGSIIGDPLMIEADRCADLRHGLTVNTRFSHAMQGGAMSDLGCYPLAIASWITGRHAVSGRGVARITAPLQGETKGVDGSMAFAVELEGGVLVSGVCSIESDEPRAVFRLIGTWGEVSTGWAWSPDPDRAEIRWRRYAAHPQSEGEGVIAVEHAGDKIVNQFARFAAAVRGEMPAVPDHGWMIGHARTMELVYESAGMVW